MRKVLIKSNQTEGVFTHNSDATTFGQLKEELKASTVKFNFTNQRAVVKPGMVDLKDEAATLPVDDFFLFLIPEKQKAGAVPNYEDMGYTELKGVIKALFETYPEAAKEHFGNYTQLSSAKMRELIPTFVALDAKTEVAVDSSVAEAVAALGTAVESINNAIPVISAAIKNLQAIAAKGGAKSNVPEKIGGLTLEELNSIYDSLVEKTKK